MKTRKTTVTITYTFSHTMEDNETDLSAVQGILNQIKSTCGPLNMSVYDREDSNKFEFVKRADVRTTGIMFSFTTIGEFVRKFANKGSWALLNMLKDYGTFVSCKATTVTEKKEPEAKEGDNADR